MWRQRGTARTKTAWKQCKDGTRGMLELASAQKWGLDWGVSGRGRCPKPSGTTGHGRREHADARRQLAPCHAWHRTGSRVIQKCSSLLPQPFKPSRGGIAVLQGCEVASLEARSLQLRDFGSCPPVSPGQLDSLLDTSILPQAATVAGYFIHESVMQAV
jgi:hypothetical protein